MKKSKFAKALSNFAFWITHFREIRKRDKVWKEEQKVIEKQAARILNSEMFQEDKLDW